LPTYGYRCPKCSTEFEVWQSMREASGAACPKCAATAVRQFFPAGIVFNGSGFYKTDSRGAATSSVTSDGGDSKTATNGAKADGAKSDAKTTKPDSPSTTTTKPVSTDAAS
jgi:putative FmdB family regulatory protein